MYVHIYIYNLSKMNGYGCESPAVVVCHCHQYVCTAIYAIPSMRVSHQTLTTDTHIPKHNEQIF